jgi:hypothetical protein
MGFLAPFLTSAGSFIGSNVGRIALTAGSSALGAALAPEDKRVEGAVIGGLTGFGGSTLARGLGGGLAKGRLASNFNPVSILKDAYTGEGALINLLMDGIPLATDIATGNLNPTSFLGVGGTLVGTGFGGRKLNRLGEQTLEDKRKELYRTYTDDKLIDSQLKRRRTLLEQDEKYSKRGSNLALDIGTNVIGYNVLAPKPKSEEAASSYDYYSRALER